MSEKKERKRKLTNRNPVKQLFITFPHSTMDKKEFRDLLLRFEPEYYKIAQETHADGTPHLHAVVKFKNKFSQSFVLKYFMEKLPDDYKRIDIKPVRSIKNAITYLSKEDPKPLESAEGFKDPRGYSKLKSLRAHIRQFRLLGIEMFPNGGEEEWIQIHFQDWKSKDSTEPKK